MPKTAGARFLSTSAGRIFFKLLRLKIAKWAIAPRYITAEDFMKFVGIDIDKLTRDFVLKQATELTQAEIMMQLPKIATESLKEASNEALAAVIFANTKLSKLQKTQITSILAGRNTADYLR